MEYSFRSCTLEDFDFLFNLKKENFKWYVDKMWGWKDEEQKERLKQDLNEISILRKYQNRGIGRKILEQQLKENQKNEIRTILQVFKDNPAKKLYERLGFKVYGETETHYQMEIIK